MEDMEEKLGTILSDPEMMQKIMNFAQSLNQSQPHQESRSDSDSTLQPDPAMLRSLAGFAGKAGIDQEQQALLKALTPYIQQDRISKLENAMRAAKLARLASRFLGNGGIRMLTGR